MTLVQTEPKSIKIGTTNIKKVTIRPNGTEKQIRPDTGWQPGANTLLYLPIDDDDTSSIVYDHSTNQANFTWYGTAGYSTLSSGKKVMNFTMSNGIYGGSAVITSQPYTINIWIYQDGTQNQDATVISNQRDNGNYGNILSYCNTTTLIDFYGGGNGNWYSYSTNNGTVLSTGMWHNVVVTVSGNTIKFYSDNSLIKTNSYTVAPNFTNSTVLSIGYLHTNGGNMNYRYFKGKIGAVIIEDKARTATEITDYYNLTKGNYGL